MPKIICKVQLGVRMQQVYIEGQKYSNKKSVETYWMPVENLSSFIADQEDVTDAYLKGPKEFIAKVEEDTHTKELTKYTKEKTVFHTI